MNQTTTHVPSHDLPSLSVVIIGRNEGERLETMQFSPRKPSRAGTPKEIFYVDSGLNRRQPRTRRQSSEPSCFRCLLVHSPPRALETSAGEDQRGEMVLFLDGRYHARRPIFPLLALTEVQKRT